MKQKLAAITRAQFNAWLAQIPDNQEFNVGNPVECLLARFFQFVLPENHVTAWFDELLISDNSNFYPKAYKYPAELRPIDKLIQSAEERKRRWTAGELKEMFA